MTITDQHASIISTPYPAVKTVHESVWHCEQSNTVCEQEQVNFKNKVLISHFLQWTDAAESLFHRTGFLFTVIKTQRDGVCTLQMVPFERLHKHDSDGNGSFYCAFQNYANSEVQKPPSQLRFSPPSIIITITSNEPWNKETPKTDRNPSITNHKPWPFEPVEVNFCFLRDPLRWLTAAKNSNVSCLLNFRIRVFLKSSVRRNKFNKQQLCVSAPPLCWRRTSTTVA